MKSRFPIAKALSTIIANDARCFRNMLSSRMKAKNPVHDVMVSKLQIGENAYDGNPSLAMFAQYLLSLAAACLNSTLSAEL